MTKQEKLEFLEKLKKHPRISKLLYDKKILEDGRDDSIWYDNSVLSFILDNRYAYDCVAIGDIRITHIPTDDLVVSKGYDAATIVDFLEEHGFATDDQVYEAEREGILCFGNNNWFEDHLYDLETKEWLDDGLDVSDGPFQCTAEELIEYLDQIITDKGRS